MSEKELDLGPIEACYRNGIDLQSSIRFDPDLVIMEQVNTDIAALVAEVKRLREDSKNCIVGIKELMDNAKKALDSFPEFNDDWVACNYRYQSYRNAYIRTKNMLDWEDSGMSFVHFKPVKE